MAEQMDIFNDTREKTGNHKKKDNNDNENDESNESVDKSSKSDEDTHEYKKMHTYEITRTKLSLHDLADRMVSRFYWATNDTVPESGSQVIHVDYRLSYDTIQRLYDQERIITYYTEHTYTTWINKSVKKQSKSKRRKQ